MKAELVPENGDPPIPVDDWTHDNLAERIAEVRQLYLDTLKDWPHDEIPVPALYKRKKAPAKPELESADVVEDLSDVSAFGQVSCLCRQDLAERGLGPLDSRACDGLSAKVGLDQDVRVR